MPNWDMPPMQPKSKEDEEKKPKVGRITKSGTVQTHENLHDAIEQEVIEREK